MGWDKVDRDDFESFKAYVEGRFGAVDKSIVGIDQKLSEKLLS